MRVTRPAHLILIDLIALIIFGANTNYEVPHYAIFCSRQPLPLRPKCYPLKAEIRLHLHAITILTVLNASVSLPS
jgi:hypothetical protein